MSNNKASEQLRAYAEKEKKTKVEELTTSHGCPVGQRLATMTAGKRGPALLKDFTYLDELTKFDRERVPERVVHAKGAGAFGYFEVTHDITEHTKAIIFDKIGKRTPMAARFSQVTGELGSADTIRDPRGFALKFYTEHGIWDMVCNNTPIFFIRDPILFPSFIHSQKRNPVTHLKDPNMFWDFVSLRPETAHQITWLFGDRGISDGYRHMHGFGGHAFKLVNAKGGYIYCKFHWICEQGIRNLSFDRARELAGYNPDYMLHDLYNAIERGDHPTWTLKIQLMTEEQADTLAFNPFDITKVWPHGDFPLHPVGKMVLTRNPTNYFTDVEQIAFSPAHLIPGIDVSPDKMLQGRLPSYTDTQYHRIGVNFKQLPVNCPFRVNTYQRDGAMCYYGPDAPNYYPNSFHGPEQNESIYKLQMVEEAESNCNPNVARYETRDEDNFSQTGIFWRKVLTEPERVRLINNMAQNLCKAEEFIQQRVVAMFTQCDEDYGKRLREALDTLNNEVFQRMRFEHPDEPLNIPMDR